MFTYAHIYKESTHILILLNSADWFGLFILILCNFGLDFHFKYNK